MRVDESRNKLLLTAAVLRRRGCASWLRWKHDSKLVAMRDE
jgi:hypothetical protein